MFDDLSITSRDAIRRRFVATSLPAGVAAITLSAIAFLHGATPHPWGSFPSIPAVMNVAGLVVGLTILFGLLVGLTWEVRRISNVNRRLEKMLQVDELTFLANRRAFDAALSTEWRRAYREQTPVSLLMVDIDHFKRFNDHYGHPAGDECIRAVARVLASNAQRPADIVARVGGEEFAILLPTTEGSGARRVAELVRAAVASLNLRHETSQAGYVTVSVGTATLQPFDALSTGALLVGAADQELYRAKSAGRNTVCGGREEGNGCSTSPRGLPAQPPDRVPGTVEHTGVAV